MTQITFIVSRNHLDIVPKLARENRAGNVEIIVDRRQREGRQGSQQTPFQDRRHFQRRSESTSRELELIGVAVVVNPLSLER